MANNMNKPDEPYIATIARYLKRLLNTSALARVVLIGLIVAAVIAAPHLKDIDRTNKTVTKKTGPVKVVAKPSTATPTSTQSQTTDAQSSTANSSSSTDTTPAQSTNSSSSLNVPPPPTPYVTPESTCDTFNNNEESVENAYYQSAVEAYDTYSEDGNSNDAAIGNNYINQDNNSIVSNHNSYLNDLPTGCTAIPEHALEPLI